MSGVRYAIFVHEPDGDSGDGAVVGPFQSGWAADEKADQIVRAAGTNEHDHELIEAIVLPVHPGKDSARLIADAVLARGRP